MGNRSIRDCEFGPNARVNMGDINIHLHPERPPSRNLEERAAALQATYGRYSPEAAPFLKEIQRRNQLPLAKRQWERAHVRQSSEFKGASRGFTPSANTQPQISSTWKDLRASVPYRADPKTCNHPTGTIDGSCNDCGRGSFFTSPANLQPQSSVFGGRGALVPYLADPETCNHPTGTIDGSCNDCGRGSFFKISR
jgi:hypothetical protein